VTAAGQINGTPAHMSPEQAAGRPVDWRSDMFSLGTMLYEMASGIRPFRGGSTIAILSSIVRDDPPPVATLRRDVPRLLDAIVAQCLSKDPAKRPPATKPI
jgi:eukaryotic-like serine/threonine-protein kinase